MHVCCIQYRPNIMSHVLKSKSLKRGHGSHFWSRVFLPEFDRWRHCRNPFYWDFTQSSTHNVTCGQYCIKTDTALHDHVSHVSEQHINQEGSHLRNMITKRTPWNYARKLILEYVILQSNQGFFPSPGILTTLSHIIIPRLLPE